MINKVARNHTRKIRHARVRDKVFGSDEMLRLNVFRSNKNIFAQVINDLDGKTIVSASTLEKSLKIDNGSNIEAAKAIGKEIALRCKKANITKVVFDRGGYLYHGRVKALAEAARENGLEF